MKQPNEMKSSQEEYRKPTSSYAAIITAAIENSERKMLTLSEIYQSVLDKYPYFHSSGPGWKNSIRHNLSLNKSFVRLPRPMNEPGKGAYWQIDHSVSKEDARPKKARVQPRRTGSVSANHSFASSPPMTAATVCPHHLYYSPHANHRSERHSMDALGNGVGLNGKRLLGPFVFA
ncbi:hypothetical protein BY458DRAFT_486121 [Sporodiniella umbellata]|nr:hypothetical protein BY458DRAFT_486121 [Sporodiniella umbellata]